ncbi:MAG TPA: VWA domain-containing protein, partial [Candidatus Competibacteraceae bacterium]|nr:VWA domain-containing protein [Candidatus Competibacteraceae bacterium]
RQQQDRKRRRAERVEDADGRHGLLAFRLESLFSWAEYVPVDRTADEDDADARRIADDLEVLSLARDQRRTTAARLRFDLDLPAAAADDTPLGPGLRLPEWDYRRGTYRPDYCLLQPMLPARAEPAELPPHLRTPARRLRRQFQALLPRKHWRRGEPDGAEPDLDAWLHHLSERRRGQASAEPRLYREQRFAQRDLACLLLADLSMSTDSWLDNHHRVIDLIRDSLHLFAEALTGGGDHYALAGFSSRKRGHVRFHPLKDFAEPLSATVRGRIQAIRPGYYTRMGAAIRHASQWLARQPAQQRLLILLSDGKPNDLDHYEGRYGIEDTRMAVLEARRQGLRPFCVTIDKEGNDYLPYLFGQGGYLLIRRPAELPRRLPLLYARLSALARGAG